MEKIHGGESRIESRGGSGAVVLWKWSILSGRQKGRQHGHMAEMVSMFIHNAQTSGVEYSRGHAAEGDELRSAWALVHGYQRPDDGSGHSRIVSPTVRQQKHLPEPGEMKNTRFTISPLPLRSCRRPNARLCCVWVSLQDAAYISMYIEYILQVEWYLYLA